MLLFCNANTISGAINVMTKPVNYNYIVLFSHGFPELTSVLLVSEMFK